MANLTATVTKKGFFYKVIDANGIDVSKEVPNLLKSQANTAGGTIFKLADGTWSLEDKEIVKARRGRPANPNKAKVERTPKPKSVAIEPTEGMQANVTQAGRLFRVVTAEGLDITESVEWGVKMKARKKEAPLVFVNGAWGVQNQTKEDCPVCVEGTKASIVNRGRFIDAHDADGLDITHEVPQKIRLKARNKGVGIVKMEGEWVLDLPIAVAETVEA